VLNVIWPKPLQRHLQSLLSTFPILITLALASEALSKNKLFVKYINPTIQHNWGFTVDHNLTSKQSIHYTQWRNTFHNHGFDNDPIALPPNPLNGLRYFPNIGSVFLLNYSFAITPHLVMTAGAGWVGEINNQFNVIEAGGKLLLRGRHR